MSQFPFLPLLASFSPLPFKPTFSISRVLGVHRRKSGRKGERSSWAHNSIRHQSTYVGDTMEGRAKEEVERKKRGLTWMRRDLGNDCWYKCTQWLQGKQTLLTQEKRTENIDVSFWHETTRPYLTREYLNYPSVRKVKNLPNTCNWK